MTLSHFNIALFLENPEAQKTQLALAQSNCKKAADQYLLGKDAWPHVTLCQIEVQEEAIKSIWDELSPLLTQGIDLNFHHLYILPGTGEHLGFHWVGLAIARDRELIQLQSKMHETLLSKKIESRTTPSSYFPHLTWARCKGEQIQITHCPDEEIWQKPERFCLSIGRSDNLGIFRERLMLSDWKPGS